MPMHKKYFEMNYTSEIFAYSSRFVRVTNLDDVRKKTTTNGSI